VRAQMKRVPRDITFDIRKKVFIGRDVESRGPALPFDFECPAGVDLGEGVNCSVFCFDVPITSNSHPSASNSQHDTASQKYKNDLLHGKYDFSGYDAATSGFGFKEIFCCVKIVIPTELEESLAAWRRKY
jgi:hypothetical protein